MKNLVLKNFNAQIQVIDIEIKKLSDEKTIIRDAMFMVHQLTGYLLNGKVKAQEHCTSNEVILDQVFSLTKKILNDEGYTVSFLETNKRIFQISMD